MLRAQLSFSRGHLAVHANFASYHFPIIVMCYSVTPKCAANRLRVRATSPNVLGCSSEKV